MCCDARVLVQIAVAVGLKVASKSLHSWGGVCALRGYALELPAAMLV